MDLKKLYSRETGFLLVVFVAGQLMGDFLGFHQSLSQYDTFMHFVGGCLVSSVLIKYLIEKLERFSFAANVFFTLGIGAVWEIFEFFIDTFLGFTTQGSLEDTMIDLIIVFSAAVVINFVYWAKNYKSS